MNKVFDIIMALLASSLSIAIGIGLTAETSISFLGYPAKQ